MRDSKRSDTWLCHFIPRSNPERNIAGILVCRGNARVIGYDGKNWEKRLLEWMTKSTHYFSASGGRCTSKMTFREGKLSLGSLLLSLYSHFESLRNGETHIWNQLKQTSGIIEASTLDLSTEEQEKILVLPDSSSMRKSDCYCLK